MKKREKENMRLPAEWEEQDGVLLALPHESTDWVDNLEEATKTYIEIIYNISRYERVILITKDIFKTTNLLNANKCSMDNISLYRLNYNDTWARDFGPITLVDSEDKPHMRDFIFNGWGLKFKSNFDNLINKELLRLSAFKNAKMKSINFVLEGGGIESDGKGTIMTTSKCQLSPNRNPPLNIKNIEKKLKKHLHIERILWLDYGFLEGDDTDSHIDTLARFAPNDTILYISCEDENDIHYQELLMMKEGLKSFRTENDKKYKLIPLPMPKAIFDENGNRLPATYANFLVINGAVLVPTYDDPDNDKKAIDIMKAAFPKRDIIPIDCLPLIEQHGSLHCVTMQIPKGAL